MRKQFSKDSEIFVERARLDLQQQYGKSAKGRLAPFLNAFLREGVLEKDL